MKKVIIPVETLHWKQFPLGALVHCPCCIASVLMLQLREKASSALCSSLSNEHGGVFSPSSPNHGVMESYSTETVPLTHCACINQQAFNYSNQMLFPPTFLLISIQTLIIHFHFQSNLLQSTGQSLGYGRKSALLRECHVVHSFHSSYSLPLTLAALKWMSPDEKCETR